jgi:F-type H+-transporting ATPase subunit epsilon
MSGKVYCTIVTPEKTALDQRADFVALPLYDGEFGVAADHSPVIGRLGFGELRLRLDDVVTRFYVDGGFVQVADNRVTVLTGHALPAEQVDEAAATRQLKEALKRPAGTRELMQIRDRLIAQARAQLRVARRAK